MNIADIKTIDVSPYDTLKKAHKKIEDQSKVIMELHAEIGQLRVVTQRFDPERILDSISTHGQWLEGKIVALGKLSETTVNKMAKDISAIKKTVEKKPKASIKKPVEKKSRFWQFWRVK
jgi:hypothetical protein